MQFELLAPFWLILLIPAFAVFWFCRTRNRGSDILRLITVIIVVLALSEPRIRWERKGGTLIVIADKSKSMPANAAAHQKELIHRIDKQRTAHDRLGVISFSGEAFVEKKPDESAFEDFTVWHSGDASELNTAIEHALALIPPKQKARILIMSDGRSTGNSPLEAAALAASRGIAVDYNLMEQLPLNDLAILSFNPPIKAEKGEAFQFSAEIYLPRDTEIRYQLFRGETVIASGKAVLQAGTRRIAFQDRIPNAGDHVYRLQVASDLDDTVPENNLAEAVTTVSGTKPILITGPAGSRFTELARAVGITAISLEPEKLEWSLPTLSHFSAVILENVPSVKLGFEGQNALKYYVENTGGALMMTGGRMSYGTGGYFATPVESVLPVSMELRKEHRRLRTAVVVALDRSGSMAMQVPGGKTKMDLANHGTNAMLELLSEGDILGVIAVDSQPHDIVKPTAVNAQNRGAIAGRIREIQSMGGGIFVYEALLRAREMLIDIESGTRHIILFSDACDSEEPGDYKNFIPKHVRSDGITISVIGLGKPNDPDSDLLRDIARLGGGNIYFSESGMDLPQLFAQEAISVFRNSFNEEKTPVAIGSDIMLVGKVPAGSPPDIGGFNLTYLKPGASMGIQTTDSYKAPVMAFWNCGAGRVMAFTNEIDGKYTGDFGKWDQSGDIYLSALRWLAQSAGEDEDPDIFVSSENKNGYAVVTLELDPDRKTDPFSSIPRLVSLKNANGLIEQDSVPFEWVDKNTLRKRVRISDSGRLSLYTEVLKGSSENESKNVISCGTFTKLYSQEFAPELDLARGRSNLMYIAELTGGVDRLNINHIYDDIEIQRGAFPLWGILALIALILLVAEIAWNRLGISAKLDFKLVFDSARKASKKVDKRAQREYRDNVDTKKSAVRKAPEGNVKKTSLGSALSEAKNKGKKRF